MPLALGLALIALMTSWKRGRDLLLARWQQDSMPLALVPRAAAAVAHRARARPGGVPDRQARTTCRPSLLHNLKHNKVLHEQVLFVTVQNLDVPEVPARSAAPKSSELAPGIHRVILRYGFMESPNIPRALEDLQGTDPVRPDAGQLFPRPRGVGAGHGAEAAAGGGCGCSC